MATKNKINNDKNIDFIFRHNKAMDLIPFVINKNDIEGYVYCIENKLFNGYSEPIYKISSTVNIENMLESHNATYFENTELLKKIKVPRKLFYEYMLILKLHKYRICPNKNFYVNLNEINKAFDELEKLLKNKTQDYIHVHYLKYMDNFDINSYCSKPLKIINKSTNLPEIKLFKKKNLKINMNSNNSGFIYFIEHPYIKNYYNDKIQILIPTKENKVPWINSNFIEDIKILRVLNVEYLDVAKNMIYELTYFYNIKTYYYATQQKNIFDLLDLIEKYFTTYSDKLQLNFAFGQRIFK
jgi:hypothetical protein